MNIQTLYASIGAAGVALVAERRNPKAVRVTNIFPRDKDELPFAEYNAIARQLHEALRAYCRAGVAVPGSREAKTPAAPGL